jgi:diacylglycerol kinase family enzyme
MSTMDRAMTVQDGALTASWGGHLRNRLITVERTRAVSVASDRPLPLQVDGEPWGSAPFDVSVVPGALRVRV